MSHLVIRFIPEDKSMNPWYKYSIVSKSEKISDSIINIYKLPNSNEESIPELCSDHH